MSDRSNATSTPVNDTATSANAGADTEDRRRWLDFRRGLIATKDAFRRERSEDRFDLDIRLVERTTR